MILDVLVFYDKYDVIFFNWIKKKGRHNVRGNYCVKKILLETRYESFSKNNETMTTARDKNDFEQETRLSLSKRRDYCLSLRRD